jgi:H+-transporting ATPase
VLLVAYAWFLEMSLDEIIPLILTAVLASIPVALPATFTLAAALGARALAKRGVLPTRLSAVDEAASMDVLCADKTGTLTRNALTVTTVHPMPGFDPRRTSWRWPRWRAPMAARIPLMEPFAQRLRMTSSLMRRD